jgi:hypothetical protein
MIDGLVWIDGADSARNNLAPPITSWALDSEGQRYPNKGQPCGRASNGWRVERAMGIENTAGAHWPFRIMKLQARRALRAIVIPANSTLGDEWENGPQ